MPRVIDRNEHGRFCQQRDTECEHPRLAPKRQAETDIKLRIRNLFTNMRATFLPGNVGVIRSPRDDTASVFREIKPHKNKDQPDDRAEPSLRPDDKRRGLLQPGRTGVAVVATSLSVGGGAGDWDNFGSFDRSIA